jgi:hypothetical protein
MLLALCESVLEQARTQGHRWIEDQRDRLLRDGSLVVGLIGSRFADTRALVRRLLPATSLPEDAAQALIGRIVAHLLSLRPAPGDPEKSAVAERARDIGDILLKSFPGPLRRLGLSVLRDLLAHPMPEVQELGATLLLSHEVPAASLPEEILQLLIASSHEPLRGIGIKLLSQLPDEALLLRGGLLLSLCRQALPDVRAAIRPVVRRLAADHPIFGDRISAGLVEALLLPEEAEGVHRDLLRQLHEDLREFAEHLSPDKVLALLRTRSKAAQELGGLLLLHHADWAEAMDTAAIVKLGNHEVKAVREACRALFAHILPRLRKSAEELAAATRLLDAKWDDTREFAFGVFRDSFTGDELTPGILISICDSVREDVQRFGRELCARFFREDSGQEYLLKLSEHPSADLQLFATNYLERYAAGDPARLRELGPYFVSVLSRVNRGRVAKSRVLSFLLAEAERSEAAARIAAEILTRQSATIAVMDRARAIDTLLRIGRRYPGIPVPLRVIEPKPAGRRDAL